MAKFVFRQFGRFAIVGTIGFVIDSGGLAILSGIAGWNVYLSRLASFMVSTMVTWWLNRRHTFDMEAPTGGDTHAQEYGRYFVVQIGGGIINLGVFFWLIYLDPQLRAVPLSVLPVAAGSVAGMFWNYFGARRWVFRA